MYKIQSKQSIKQILKNRTHIGHHHNKLSKDNRNTILGIRHNIAIINPKVSIKSADNLIEVLAHLQAKRGFLMFFGGHFYMPSLQKSLYNGLDVDGINFSNSNFVTLTGSWKEGFFTNKKNLYDLMRNVIKPERNKSAKFLRYKKNFGNLFNESSINIFDYVNPDLIISLQNNKKLINESKLVGIPLIGILDSNIDSNQYLYGLYGNDDSWESLEFYISVIKAGLKKGNLNEKRLYFYLFLQKIKKSKTFSEQYKYLKCKN